MRRLALTSLAAALVFGSWWFPLRAGAEILCADDTIPEGMAITATGTVATCAGACRARRTEAVCGPIMKICADQPIPRGYVLDSLTSMPGCQCLGLEDNGYVIRYVGMRDEPDLSNSNPQDADVSPYVGSQLEPELSNSAPGRPYGDPPFGNLLCKNMPMDFRPSENVPGVPSTELGRMNPYAPQLPRGAGQIAPTPSWNNQQSEPFRLGQ
jgi:hypothetical protein